MFNKSIITLKNICLFMGAFLVLFSCKKDLPLSFTEQHLETSENAIVDINYPKAEGGKAVADRINKTIENFLANEINMSEMQEDDLSLSDAIINFDNEYKSFKEDFSDSTQQWEAMIESEVTYISEAVICVSVNSYIDTGGAHGNSRVAFLSFDKKTGTLLKSEDLITDEEAFKDFVKPYFIKATQSLSNDNSFEDLFFGEDFQLPENIGFGEDGLILLYNVYEIASYSQGFTEFSIPYEKAKPYLNIY